MAEIRYAVTHEGALHLEDVLTRRTRISIEYPHRGVVSAAAVTDLIGDILGWDGARREREIAQYTARVDAELASQQKTDDADADAARTIAGEIRPGLVDLDQPAGAR
jgi:glycerol-3-phosphate dehydrogenase